MQAEGVLPRPDAPAAAAAAEAAAAAPGWQRRSKRDRASSARAAAEAVRDACPVRMAAAGDDAPLRAYRAAAAAARVGGDPAEARRLAREAAAQWDARAPSLGGEGAPAEGAPALLAGVVGEALAAMEEAGAPGEADSELRRALERRHLSLMWLEGQDLFVDLRAVPTAAFPAAFRAMGRAIKEGAGGGACELRPPGAQTALPSVRVVHRPTALSTLGPVLGALECTLELCGESEDGSRWVDAAAAGQAAQDRAASARGLEISPEQLARALALDGAADEA
jgi:hypothetical protein